MALCNEYIDVDDDSDYESDEEAEKIFIGHLTQQYCSQFCDSDDESVDETQTIDFLTQPEEAADVLKESPPRSSKRQKADDDAKNKKFVSIGGSKSLFMIGDTYWKCSPMAVLGKGIGQNPVLTLVSFHLKRNQWGAECMIHVPLSETFVEVDHIDITKETPNTSYVRMRKTKWFRLRDLSDRRTERPSTPLVYEASDAQTHGDNFSIAYNYDCGGRPKSEIDYIQTAESNAPRALDLFAGVGGASIGLARAGFCVECAVEIDSITASSLKLNHPDIKEVYDEDVRVVLEKSKQGDPCYPKPGHFQHIHASPPCQGYSMANRSGKKGECERVKQRRKESNHKNNELSLCFADAVEHFLPDTGTMENVRGMLYKGREYVQRIIVRLLCLRYQVRISIVNSSDFGDAQARSRIVLFVTREDWILPSTPIATNENDFQLPVQTVADAIGDLAEIPPIEGTGFVMVVKENQSVRIANHVLSSKIRESTATEDSDNYIKLDPHKPAPTVRTNNKLIHYSSDRTLTIREFARLQSFPDEFRFFGGPLLQRKQIGNAVPIHLATAVAKRVFDCYRITHINELFFDDDDNNMSQSQIPRRVSQS